MFSFFHHGTSKRSSPRSPSHCYLQLPALPISCLTWSTGGWRQPPCSTPLPLPFLICSISVDLLSLCWTPGLPCVNFPRLHLWLVSSLLFNYPFCSAWLRSSCYYTSILGSPGLLSFQFNFSTRFLNYSHILHDLFQSPWNSVWFLHLHTSHFRLASFPVLSS